jgi:acetolactate synthase-1/3 small subunit
MKHTISVLVENHAGVLSRITGLFSRRGFNIDSLAVGVTEDKTVSRMTIVVEADSYTVEQLEKQLNKVVDVIKVRTIPQEDLISRELMLIKCNAGGRTRSEILDIAKIMNAKIVDLTKSTMTLEICDLPARLDLLEELLKAYNIQEVMRTGTIALQKGAAAVGAKG